MKTARAALAVLFLLVSALVFIPAPQILIWRFKLIAIEFGHWLALGPLAIIACSRWRSRVDRVATVLAALAAGAFLSGSVRAAWFSREAAATMDAAFPEPASGRGSPFSVARLWSMGSPAAVEMRTFDFASHEGAPLRLDFYRAQGRTPAPCVVVIPGGGWENCDRRGFAEMKRHLAHRGYAVAAMDYRLAPRWRWPAQKEDVLSALAFLRARSTELGLDPERFVLLGRSAGAQIAGAVSATGGHPEIIGCIMIYGPADMHFAAKYADPSDILDSDKLLRQYLGGTPAESPANYDSASAYVLAGARTPPTLLLHGAVDELVWARQSDRYAERLLGLGVQHAFLRLPWATHAFDYNFNGPGGQLEAWAVTRFLNAVTAIPRSAPH